VIVDPVGRARAHVSPHALGIDMHGERHFLLPCVGYRPAGVARRKDADPGEDVRVDGAQRAFTEPLLKDVLQKCWTSGGEPNVIMLGGFNKMQMSTFTGRGQPMEETKSKKIVNAVNTYEGDFGLQKVIPNRFMRARDVLVLQTSMWAVSYLPGRRMVSETLAKTGDSEAFFILSEYSLEARNEKSSGLIADCTTS